MKQIVLQVGHQNIKYNSDIALHGSTGAPQEMETNYRITSRAAEILRSKGIEVKQTDANANADISITDRDWDLYVAVHCDADSAQISGGFTDYPEPSTDGATVQSKKAADDIASEFFPYTGIVYRPERRQKSAGILYYYMWKFLTAATPCVLIEMGESIDPHDRVILNDTERCAVGLAKGVCKALGVAYNVAVPTTPAIDYEKKYKESQIELQRLTGEIEKRNKTIEDLNKKIINAREALA